MKKSTVRRIDEIKIVEHGTKIELLYTGNRAFSTTWCRILTGTLWRSAAECGNRGNEGDLEAKKRDMAGELSAGRLIPSSRGL